MWGFPRGRRGSNPLKFGKTATRCLKGLASHLFSLAKEGGKNTPFFFSKKNIYIYILHIQYRNITKSYPLNVSPNWGHMFLWANFVQKSPHQSAKVNQKHLNQDLAAPGTARSSTCPPSTPGLRAVGGTRGPSSWRGPWPMGIRGPRRRLGGVTYGHV